MLAQDLCSALRENLSPRGPAQALFSVREEKRRSFSFLLLCGMKSFSSSFHPFFLFLSVYFIYFTLFPKSYSFYHASSTHTSIHICTCMYIYTYTHTHPNIYTNVSLSFVVLHSDVQEVNIHIHQSNIHTYRIALCLTVLVLFFSYLTDLQICFLL